MAARAISPHVTCEDQAEIDRYREALSKDGGKPVACGWITDKYGVSLADLARGGWDYFFSKHRHSD